MTRQEKLTVGLEPSRMAGIEIGPLANPIISKNQGVVHYLDYLDTQGLRTKYADDPNVNKAGIVDIDIVGMHNALSPVDYIIASHVIEHVPDLIGWLCQLWSVLTVNGEVRLAVPDRRATFDYHRRGSSLHDVLAAYVAQAQVPSPFAVLDFHCNAQPIEIGAAWRGEIPPYEPNVDCITEALLKAREAHSGIYHDVHCWVFTDGSFCRMMHTLAQLKLLAFECAQFWPTNPNDMEFFVRMRRCNDSARIIESWHKLW